MLFFKRTIGFWHATMIGIGSLIGAGIFVLIGEASIKAGPAVIVTYILAFFSALLTALVYSELATIYKNEGGGYNFAKETLDKYSAFITGWIIITGNIVAIALGALGFSEFLSALVGIKDSWFLVASALLMIYFLGVINFISVTKASKFELYLTIAKIIILAGIAIFGLFSFNTENLQNFWDSGLPACVGSVSIIYISFFGSEAIASVNEEIKDPDKTIPRAIIGSLIFASIVYLLLAISLVGSFHLLTFENPSTVLNEFAIANIGKLGLYIISITAIIAIITAVNAGIMAASRQIYAMGRDHFLPFYLSRIHKNFHTPHFSILTICIITTILVSINGIGWIARLASTSYLIGLTIVNIALIVSRIKHKNLDRPFKTPLHPLIPILSILINLSIIVLAGWVVLINILIWILIGTSCYYLAKHYQTKWHLARMKMHKLFYRYKHHLQHKKHE